MEDFLTSFFVAPFTGLATGIASATSPLDVIDAVDGFVWDPIMILLLLSTHIFMTVRTGFIQRKLSAGIKMSVTKDDPSDASGDITQFGALTTALAATIGTGTISSGAGLATAAFEKIPVFGPLVLLVGLLAFTYSTILGLSAVIARETEHYVYDGNLEEVDDTEIPQYDEK